MAQEQVWKKYFNKEIFVLIINFLLLIHKTRNVYLIETKKQRLFEQVYVGFTIASILKQKDTKVSF